MVKGLYYWQLYDLRKDPKEMNDLARKHPDVVRHLRERYNAFVNTLPALKPSASYKGGGQVPKGWGWHYSKG